MVIPGSALVAAIAFVGTSVVILLGATVIRRGRAAASAIAAGLLLALAFGDLFPEGLAEAGTGAIAGFLGGFAFLFVVELLTHAHTHHAPDEQTHRHAILPFIIGLALHNTADGFSLAVSSEQDATTALTVGIAIVLHQLPVAISLVAVLAASGVSRRQIIMTALGLGLVIPIAAGATTAWPNADPYWLGVLTAVAGGSIAYMSATHLLPEVQAEEPRIVTGLLFSAALAVTTYLLVFNSAG